MPDSEGDTRTQSRAGSSGSGTSPRCSIDSALVATSGLPPATLTMAYDGMLRSYVSASTGLPTRPFGPTSPHGGEVKSASPSDCLLVFGRARVWHRQAPVARRHPPALHTPAPLPRDLRQSRVRVHRHRRSYQLEHRQVGQRIRVSEALGQDQSVARGIFLEQYAARLTGRRRRVQVSGQAPVLHQQAGAVDLHVQQLSERFDDDVERSGEEQHPMAGALVLSNPAHALRVNAPQRHSIERLAPETLHDLVVQPVVLAIEAALELGARPPLE